MKSGQFSLDVRLIDLWYPADILDIRCTDSMQDDTSWSFLKLDFLQHGSISIKNGIVLKHNNSFVKNYLPPMSEFVFSGNRRGRVDGITSRTGPQDPTLVTRQGSARKSSRKRTDFARSSKLCSIKPSSYSLHPRRLLRNIRNGFVRFTITGKGLGNILFGIGLSTFLKTR